MCSSWSTRSALAEHSALLTLQGRRSFPSGALNGSRISLTPPGHSSAAFYGGTFVFLFLAGRSRALSGHPSLRTNIFQSKVLRAGIAIAPLFMSAYSASAYRAAQLTAAQSPSAAGKTIVRYEACLVLLIDAGHHPTDIIVRAKTSRQADNRRPDRCSARSSRPRPT